MRNALLAIGLLAGLVGCQNGMLRRDGTLPGCCPGEDSCRTVRCPPPRVEVQAPEEVVVRAPRQKIVVEAPAACAAPQPAAAPQQAPAAPQQAPMQYPMAAPGMMPMMTYGQGFAAPTAPVTAQVQERTRLGFAFDFFRLPIPFLRPIAVQRPAEVTFQMPVAQAAPMNTVGFAAPMAMPMAAPMPMSMAAPAFAPPNMTMVPQASVGYGQMTVQTQVPVQQAALLQASGQGQMTNQQMAALLQAALAAQKTEPRSPAAAPAATPSIQDQLKECERKLKELQQLRGGCRAEPLPPPKEKSPLAPARE